MKKITFVLTLFLCLALWQSNAQHTFTTVAGPINVAAGTPITVNMNDAGNTAAVPAGVYDSFTVTADWDNPAGNPWSSEAELQVVTAAGQVADIDPPTGGGLNSGDPTTLTFSGSFSTNYDPAVDGLFDIVLGQSYTGSSADWSNIVVEIFPAPACTEGNVDTPSVFEDCVEGEFSVEIAYIDIGDSIGVSDGTTTYPIVDFDVSAGPFPAGSTVTLSVVHSDPACDFLLGDFSDTCPQPGDTCDTAVPVFEGTIIGTEINEGSNSAVMTLTGTTDGVNATWFAYTAPGDGTIDVGSCGGGADTDLAIGTGVCGTFTDVLVNDDSCDLGDGNAWASEILGYPVASGQVYYIEWSDEWSTGPFDWTLTFTAAPECNPAEVGTLEALADCEVNSEYSILVPFTSQNDATGVSDGTMTYPIVDGEAIAGPYSSGQVVTLDIVHSDPECDFSYVDLSFTCPLPQDTCDTAEAVTPGTYTTTITQGSGGSIMGSGGDSAFFIYTPSEDGTIVVDSCEGGADTFINIGTGVCEDLTSIASNDDSCPSGLGNNFASQVELAVTAGISYYIEWDDRYTTGANEFMWTLEFIPPPACDAAEFDDGTINDDDCNPDGSGQWSVVINVSDAGDAGGTFDDGVNPPVAVVVGDVTMGPYNTGDSVTIEYVNGDPACDSTVGTFEYTCPLPPPINDDASGAIDLPVGDTLCESPVLGTNENATDSDENINTADCTFAGGVPAGDVWFSVTVPFTGEITLETSQAVDSPVTDTVMTVYRGTSGNLEQVGCSDDEGTGAFSLIALTAADGISPGDVLLIRVWEYGNNVKGEFNICAWSPSSLGIDDNTLGQFTYYPNPVKETLTLNAQNTIEDVTMYNMLGQVVLKAKPNAVNSDIDMSSLSNGAYFVQVTIANITKTVRIIKQ